MRHTARQKMSSGLLACAVLVGGTLPVFAIDRDGSGIPSHPPVTGGRGRYIHYGPTGTWDTGSRLPVVYRNGQGYVPGSVLRAVTTRAPQPVLQSRLVQTPAQATVSSTGCVFMVTMTVVETKRHTPSFKQPIRK